MIAARTSRSKAYAQALLFADCPLSGAILYGQQKSGPERNHSNPVPYTPQKNELFIQDLSISLEETLKEHQATVLETKVELVNSSVVEQALQTLSPDLIVYSGYGGQIVGESILKMGIPVLHAHSGWLPHYRGSTTLYYAWLREDQLAVSALILSSGIDRGRILLRKTYNPPPSGMDPDYVYDTAIRADCLAEVLKGFKLKGSLPCGIEQEEQEGMDYYIIHPLLKHLARLKAENTLPSESL